MLEKMVVCHDQNKQSPTEQIWLVVWKIYVKLGIFPNFRGEHKQKIELPPPSTKPVVYHPHIISPSPKHWHPGEIPPDGGVSRCLIGIVSKKFLIRKYLLEINYPYHPREWYIYICHFAINKSTIHVSIDTPLKTNTSPENGWLDIIPFSNKARQIASFSPRIGINSKLTWLAGNQPFSKKIHHHRFAREKILPNGGDKWWVYHGTNQKIKKHPSSWWFKPIWKIFCQNGFSFPNFQMKNRKYLSCHHLESVGHQHIRLVGDSRT